MNRRAQDQPNPGAPQKGAPAVLWPDGGWGRQAFIDHVWAEGGAHHRDLPWRYLDDPYGVLVSEVMLQQTQVSRVIRFWGRFLEMFPTIDALAAADQTSVLQQWKGLGYPRRALHLKQCAEICSSTYGGQLPRTREQLLDLPGIGPATAGGVLAFAYEQPTVYLETNVRAVFLHDVFPDQDGVPDKTLIPLVQDTCSQDDPRGWYYALLDYGAFLKSSGDVSSRRSAHYTRQSAFEGSRRQKRSWILQRVLDAETGVAAQEVFEALNEAEARAKRPRVDEGSFDSIVEDLLSEGFFKRDGDLLLPG